MDWIVYNVNKLHQLACVLFVAVTFAPCSPQTYEDTKRIMDDVLDPNAYHPQVRPINDQSGPLRVFTAFELISIVEVNDVQQKLLANGFLTFLWTDQRLTWDPANYGNQTRIHPKVKDVWKPRVVLLNTLGDRDMFEDDHAPMWARYNGTVLWAPGSLFSVSCDLDMTSYPFDTQTCSIDMISMMYNSQEIEYWNYDNKISTALFVENGEWELIDGRVSTNTSKLSPEEPIPSFKITFVLKRFPMFLVVNIILPVVILAFLNVLIFVIPVESGEKISFGITVLLALAVFLSITSSMLPRAARKLPSLTIYLFVLLVGSVLSVIDSIFIVYLSHLEQTEDKCIRAEEKLKGAFTKVKQANKAGAGQPPSISGLLSYTPKDSTDTTHEQNGHFSLVSRLKSKNIPTSNPITGRDINDNGNNNELFCESEGRSQEKPRRNKYKTMSKYADRVSFVVFFLLWLGPTVSFLVSIAEGHTF